MCLSLGVSGMPFCGADVGGFTGHPSSGLLTTWYTLGAFQPFFRAHAHNSVRGREPWNLNKHNLDTIRESLYVRQSLIPYM